LFDTKRVTSPLVTIETKSGIKSVIYEEKTQTATVDMGKPKIISSGFVNHIDVGNPHAVIFVDNVESLNLPALGSFFEKNPYFKDGVNTEFVRVIEKNKIEMRVWERGSGETLACGTGAVASAIASISHGFCEMCKDITVKCAGGELVIHVNAETAYLMGGCETVYTGVYDESK
jgi:diaminopimelate epimerase